jgi:hypothetical protein
MQFRPLSAELFHVYNRTDRHDEANCRFSQLAAANKQLFVSSFSHTHSPNNKTTKYRRPSPDSSRYKSGGRQQGNKIVAISLETTLVEK